MAQLTREDIELKSKIKIRIKNLLNEKGFNQSSYALESDTDRQSVNRWVNENNIRGTSIYTINKFCKIFKITLTEFFNDPLFN